LGCGAKQGGKGDDKAQACWSHDGTSQVWRSTPV
jgi:hypothetical protein